MSATIIPFPKFVYPTHWSGHDQYVFDHFRRCDGLSVDEASQRGEQSIHIARVVPGEDESDRLLRMARESLRSLKRIGP